MADYLLISTTAESREVATALAHSAVAARLAASAQVFGPVTSVVWHKNELMSGEEWQVLLKTTGARYPDLETHLIAEYPWTNPEITAIPLVAGSAPYLGWIDRMTGDRS